MEQEDELRVTTGEAMFGVSKRLHDMQGWVDQNGRYDTGVASVSKASVGRMAELVDAVMRSEDGMVDIDDAYGSAYEFLSERVAPTDAERRAIDDALAPRKAWMVHTESGEYSDWCYIVKGIFSSYEAAREYVESHTITLTRDACDDEWMYDQYDDPLPSDETSEARLVTTDGTHFSYRAADGKPIYSFSLETWYVTEYEIDRGR